jgi:hypothetical protein
VSEAGGDVGVRVVEGVECDAPVDLELEALP